MRSNASVDAWPNHAHTLRGSPVRVCFVRSSIEPGSGRTSSTAARSPSAIRSGSPTEQIRQPRPLKVHARTRAHLTVLRLEHHLVVVRPIHGYFVLDPLA